jgi:hypothetical protein
MMPLTQDCDKLPLDKNLVRCQYVTWFLSKPAMSTLQ